MTEYKQLSLFDEYVDDELEENMVEEKDGYALYQDDSGKEGEYEYKVFDVIVDLLLENGGRARKGNGRNYKFGEPECDETTVVGYIAKHYWNKTDGESVFDPVFVLAAVLEWAGIVHNERGELVLTQQYRSMV